MVTKDDVLKVAKLAKLYINESELESLAGDMENIVNFANEISKVEVTENNFDSTNGLTNRLREDSISTPAKRELILKNVNGGENGFFSLKNRK